MRMLLMLLLLVQTVQASPDLLVDDAVGDAFTSPGLPPTSFASEAVDITGIAAHFDNDTLALVLYVVDVSTVEQAPPEIYRNNAFRAAIGFVGRNAQGYTQADEWIANVDYDAGPTASQGWQASVFDARDGQGRSMEVEPVIDPVESTISLSIPLEFMGAQPGYRLDQFWAGAYSTLAYPLSTADRAPDEGVCRCAIQLREPAVLQVQDTDAGEDTPLPVAVALLALAVALRRRK